MPFQLHDLITGLSQLRNVHAFEKDFLVTLVVRFMTFTLQKIKYYFMFSEPINLKVMTVKLCIETYNFYFTLTL
jgi:hypothetical protein